MSECNVHTQESMIIKKGQFTLAAGRPVVVMSTEACNTVWKVFCVMSKVSTRFTDCPAATVPA